MRYEELDDSYSPDTISVIKSRMMRWSEHEEEIRTGSWWQYFKKRNHLEDLRIDWKIILQLILNRVGGCGLNSFGLERKKWQGG